jgi:hypothetical protein
MDTKLTHWAEIGLALLVVTSLLLQACGLAPDSDAANSRPDARMLLLAIHSLALGEEDAEDAGLGPRGTGALLRPAFLSDAGPIDEVKAAIRELEAQCARSRTALRDALPEPDATQAIASLDGVCQAELSKLQAVLSDLRAGRARRSWWKRTVAGRVLARAWTFTRQTVRRSRTEILLALVTGGGGLAVKRILIQQGRADLKRELQTEFGRALAHDRVSADALERADLSPGTWPPSRADAEDQPASETEAAAAAQAVIEETSRTADFSLPADGRWTAVCKHRDPGGWIIDWTLSLNLSARSFDARAEWNRSAVEQGGWLYSHHLIHEGSGSITEDGMLEGPFREVETTTWSKAGVNGGPQTSTSEGRMYGVISADLKSICISRGEDPGAYDIDYIRRLGREAFFEPGSGCEAECTITAGP